MGRIKIKIKIGKKLWITCVKKFFNIFFLILTLEIQRWQDWLRVARYHPRKRSPRQPARTT